MEKTMQHFLHDTGLNLVMGSCEGKIELSKGLQRRWKDRKF